MDAFHHRTNSDVTEILSFSSRSIFPKRLKDACRKNSFARFGPAWPFDCLFGLETLRLQVVFSRAQRLTRLEACMIVGSI